VDTSILEELVASLIWVEENIAEYMSLKMNVSVSVVFYSHSEDLSNTLALYIQDQDDLPFKKGEVLTVLSKDEDQWWTARNSLGQVGSIPVPYVQKVGNSLFVCI